jgi:translation initiation factor IF-2
MERLKLFEAAAQLKLSCAALSKLLTELGYEVKGYSSYITPEAFWAVRRRLKEEKKFYKSSLRRKRRPEPKGVIKPRLDEERIDRSVRETMRKLEHRTIRPRRRPQEVTQPEVPTQTLRVLKVTPYMSLAELAHLMEVAPAELIKKCFDIGMLATINQRLDMDTITLLAEEYSFKVEEEEVVPSEFEAEPSESKPPVVVVMGHVDHGKTTLLDYIRKTKVTQEEPGSITQHTGAYKVTYKGRSIVFLDTPGHEAFTAMRARGTQITDLAVLVIAADEGVMPQTREAINHARAAGVPILVAITKMDLPTVNPARVKAQLSEVGLTPEEHGGRTITVEVSAVAGTGIDDLLAGIILMAEELNLRARSSGPAQGVVVDARMDRGRGNLATVLIQEGALHRGEYFLCGEHFGRVRELLTPDTATRIDAAPPATPVVIVGLSGLPQAGDRFQVVKDERTAREIAQRRATARRERELLAPVRLSLEELQAEIQAGTIKELNVILKGDVSGTVEALKEAMEGLSLEEVKLRLIHSGVGSITPSDILLARASSAVVIGFHVEPLAEAKQLADKEGVEIRTYQVIYNLLDDLRSALVGLLEPKEEEVLIGRAQVRQVFRISKVGIIAGCYVLEGEVRRDARIRVIRNGKVVFSGTIRSLKRFKEDVRKVEAGYECGVGVEGLTDLTVDDELEVYELQVSERS